MGMENQRDRRARACAGVESAFKATLRAWENHFWHRVRALT